MTFPRASFDYVVGMAMLSHESDADKLAAALPSAQAGRPDALVRGERREPPGVPEDARPAVGRWTGDADCQIGMRKSELVTRASHQGFAHVEIVPYDILHSLTPRP